ncbi:hypothetical protein [Bacillus infantis]|uniref:Uncharacterized protein n=1 Tax=Bacillus infantis TaxID=324767 RepID=A0A5D4R961_9BACI|nr:hypothetical protein [Bacillus infantis]TYS46761.1 hypothetical protein FZD51_14915 [Bacillus infantis]
MFENEDMILPDDFQEAADLPQSDDLDTVETVEDTTDTGQTEDSTTSEQQAEEQRQAFLKVKYNKEELDLGEDEARELAQKGLNYDKTLERLQALESDPRLTFVEELASEFNMTVPEYLEAVQQQKEQERLNELIQQNIPEELAKEILESRKDRETRKQEQEEKSNQEKANAEYLDFFDYYKSVNGKDFDANTDQIPAEVWEANKSGVPLKYAFMEHHNNQLLSQVKILKQNEENAKSSPVGSVTTHGSTETAVDDDFLKGFNSI